MDSRAMAIEQGQEGNLAIYRDNLAPQPSLRPRARAWDRAPVPAHAPRIAGQRIWKKPKTSAQVPVSPANKAHSDALEHEGMGARKRARVMGAGKENIGEPKFKLVKEEVGEFELVDGVMSPRKRDGREEDRDALVVPRKRTNANRMVTPRKALQQVQGNEQSPAQVAQTAVLSGDDMTERPVRRRKSMRKSRRLTQVNDLKDVPPATIASPWSATKNAEDTANRVQLAVSTVAATPSKLKSAQQSPKTIRRQAQEAFLQALFKNVDTDPAEERAREPARDSVEESVPVLTLDDVITLVKETQNIEAVTEMDIPDVDSDQLDVMDVLNIAVEEPEDLGFMADIPEENNLSDLDPVHLASLDEDALSSKQAPVSASPNENTLEGSSLDDTESEVISIDNIETFEVSSGPDRIIDFATLKNVKLDTIVKTFNETPDKTFVQSPILDSRELNTRPASMSPTKSTATPRSNKNMSQARPTRQSTRNTRASSVFQKDGLAPTEALVFEPQAAPAQLTSPSKSNAQAISAQVDSDDSQVNPPSLEAAENSSAEIGASASTTSADQVSSLEELQMDDFISDNSDENSGVIMNGEATAITTAPYLDTQEAASQDMKLATTKQQLDVDMLDNDDMLAEEQLREEFSSGDDLSSMDLTAEDDMTVHFAPMEIDSVQPSVLEENLEQPAQALEIFEQTSASEEPTICEDHIEEPSTELQESSTPNPSTTELTQAISENAPVASYDHDDTDMLRRFLSRVKANKAAKSKTSIPKRKRSLPHSPLQIPLGTLDTTSPPSPPKSKDEFDVSIPQPSPSKRRKRNDSAHNDDDTLTEPGSVRRSGRTRLPIKAAAVAPSCIPVRTRGQDDSTVTLRKTEQTERVALTKFNTRKNKGGSRHPAEFLAKKAEEKEKEDPASRQRALKEVFDEKTKVQKLSKKKKRVVWSEELVEFQGEEGRKVTVGKTVETVAEGEKDKEKVVVTEKKEVKPVTKTESVEVKKSVKVGVRSKMALGMAANGTPAPKRRVRK